ncbi:hypothetical protein CDO51_12300 [Natranaerobius trueperi]|uniref:Inner membrane protein YgaP-like transmembrane domain-containing protein n=1 Tax=Natranaerobius trueperi TaxID=759412 RepID=A0A226BXC1_9FIRM|nr:hypothetical protein CDO51_12300 [Natranaerobius trueperi]
MESLLSIYRGDRLNNSIYIEKNVGHIDRIIRSILGLLLIIAPVIIDIPVWVAVILAGIGGANIIEGIIGF